MFLHNLVHASYICLSRKLIPSAFVFRQSLTSCHDLGTVVLPVHKILQVLRRPVGELLPFLFLPSLPLLLALFIIYQHSCLFPLSRVHPREDECAVTMLVENTLYKPCAGPCCVRVNSLCLSGPLWRAVRQHRSVSPGSSLWGIHTASFVSF